MKAAPIVQHLQNVLPRYTSRFSDSVVINEIVAENGVATVTLATPLPVDIDSNDSITIANAVIAVPVTQFQVSSGVAYVRTGRDHGMVLGFNFKDKTLTTIAYLRGFSDASLNGDFPIEKFSNLPPEVLPIPNRFNFRFATSLADGTYTADGFILNYVSGIFNGYIDATVVSPTEITFPVPSVTTEIKTVEPSELHYNIRVGKCGTVDRTEDTYTNYEEAGYVEDKYYAFVVAGDTTLSKDRSILSDSQAAPTAQSSKRYFLYEDVHVCVFAPVSDDLVAEETRDDLEDVKIALMRALLYYYPESQYAVCSYFSLVFIGDSELQTDRNRMARTYTFQCQYQISLQDGDLTQNIQVPFRGVNAIMNVNNSDLEVKNINLDQEPVGE